MGRVKMLFRSPNFLQIVFPSQFLAQFYSPTQFFVVIPAVSETQISFFQPFLNWILIYIENALFIIFATGGLFDLAIAYFYHSRPSRPFCNNNNIWSVASSSFFGEQRTEKTISSSTEVIEFERFTNRPFSVNRYWCLGCCVFKQLSEVSCIHKRATCFSGVAGEGKAKKLVVIFAC